MNVQPVQAGWQPITLRSIALRPVAKSSSKQEDNGVGLTSIQTTMNLIHDSITRRFALTLAVALELLCVTAAVSADSATARLVHGVSLSVAPRNSSRPKQRLAIPCQQLAVCGNAGSRARK